MDFKKHHKTLFNNSRDKYDITRHCLYIRQPATHQCTFFAPERHWLVLLLQKWERGMAVTVLKREKATCWFCNISVNMGTLEQLGYE